MSKHVSYRGITIDMDTLRRENEKTTAIGNMKVNARGDQINRGKITKTADEIARENHRIQTAVINKGLKGAPPKAPENLIENKPKEKKLTKTKETELPSGDIIIEEDKS